MKLFVDTANTEQIDIWRQHPWVSGFTTNPSLYVKSHDPSVAGGVMQWAKDAVEAADGFPISIDGPPEVWELGQNVWRKVTGSLNYDSLRPRVNLTAICHTSQVPRTMHPRDIISVFCGRIMDTGRDPQPVIDAAKATDAQVLWASVREPYNIVQAEAAGCDVVTVPPAILQKYLDWQGKPLEKVAEETIAQFAKDSEGLWI